MLFELTLKETHCNTSVQNLNCKQIQIIEAQTRHDKGKTIYKHKKKSDTKGYATRKLVMYDGQ